MTVFNHLDKKIFKKSKNYFEKNGFVNFRNILASEEIDSIDHIIRKLVKNKKLRINKEDIANNNDIIYLHSKIENLAKNKKILKIIKYFIESDFELQHSKFNPKPTQKISKKSEVMWHQDYPFYPHTNFDLISCIIHLDDEDTSNGALEFILGSHLHGPKSHCNLKGRFVNKCTDKKFLKKQKIFKPIFKKGDISFHHCLTLHRSGTNTSLNERRLMVFQYKAIDAVQLAGVIWKCHGHQVFPKKSLQVEKRYARFLDGTKIELRGRNSRLIDVGGKFKPDE